MIDTEHFKHKLEEEKRALESELAKVGRKNPDNPSDWEAKVTEQDVSQADENNLADSITAYEDNNAIMNTLESRYNDVKSGIDKIKHGVFGRCQVCQKEIEIERLEANPAARTCQEHMN